MKHKKTSATAAFLILSLGGLYAQDAVPSSGGVATGAGGSLSYSVGQVVYTTNDGGTSGTVAQGVQQPFEISITTGIDIEEIDLMVSAFPNPAQHFLTISVENYEEGNLSYHLYDAQGKLLSSSNLTSKTHVIDMQDMPTSTYHLVVLGESKKLKSFQIIKTQ